MLPVNHPWGRLLLQGCGYPMVDHGPRIFYPSDLSASRLSGHTVLRIPSFQGIVNEAYVREAAEDESLTILTLSP